MSKRDYNLRQVGCCSDCASWDIPQKRCTDKCVWLDLSVQEAPLTNEAFGCVYHKWKPKPRKERI